MMLDAYQPEGITMLAVDSIFMMPHLGILSTVHPQAAAQVFERDCLIKLGDCVAGVGPANATGLAFSVNIDGTVIPVQSGEMKLIPLGLGEKRTVTIRPGKGWNLGAGKNKAIEDAVVEGGVVGLVLDGRSRPLTLPASAAERAAKLNEWLAAMALPTVAGA
jgi:hypothetical protein